MGGTLGRLMLWIAIVAALYLFAQVTGADEGFEQGPRRPLPPPTAQLPPPPAPAPAPQPTPRPETLARPEAPLGTPRPPAQPPAPQPGPRPPVMDIVVEEGSGRKGDSIGTAFLVAEGIWISAAHVIDDCRTTYVRASEGWRTTSGAVKHNTADAAVLYATGSARAPRLPVSNRAPTLNQDGFHIGYPQGTPSSVHTRLVGIGRIRQGKPGTPIEQGWVWAEMSRVPQTSGSLGGISGGPQLDPSGAVQSITILHSERAGRVTTAPIQRTRELMANPIAGVPAGDARITPANFADYGTRLRDVGTVALVFCSVSGNTRPRR